MPGKTNKPERLDYNKIVDNFEEAFKQNAEQHDVAITDVECHMDMSDVQDNPKIEVTSYGLAGGLTRAQVYDKQKLLVPEIKKIKVPYNTRELIFEFREAVTLNSNDYVMIYQLVTPSKKATA